MSKAILQQPLRAVRIAQNNTRTLCSLPAQAKLEILDKSRIPGMVEVQWNGEAYAVFAVDLKPVTVNAQ
jgi:hypothetical protein